jgi:hypothetical protein
VSLSIYPDDEREGGERGERMSLVGTRTTLVPERERKMREPPKGV